MSWRGELLHIHVTTAAGQPMRALADARLVVGYGIEGDRYATRTGKYSPSHHIDRQATIFESEVLEALARDHGVDLAPGEHRRNLTSRGVPLSHLVGRYFHVGDCILFGGRLNVPCRYLEEVTGKKVFKALLNRSGLNCRIVVGGTIRPGDHMVPCDLGELDPGIRAANEAIPLERPPEVW
jgi:MOSC domain-containing protein YiiM